MPIFDISESVGVWFDFPGGGRVRLKSPTPDDMLRIRKATTEIRPFPYQDGPALKVLNHEVVDYDKQSVMYHDCAISAWEDFFDRNNAPISCTLENKTILMRLNDSTFRDFVNEKLLALAEAETAKTDAEKKI